MLKRIVLFLLCILSLTSCTTVENEGNITFTDSEGEKMIESVPTNVALLYPSYADIWLTAKGDIKIGVEDIVNRGFKDEVIVVGSGTGKDIDLEALVSSQPDFVVLSLDFPNHVELASSLKGLGISYGIFKLETVDDYYNLLLQFMRINDSVSEFEGIKSEIDEKIDTAIQKRKANSAGVREKVLLLRATSTKLKALNNTNFVGVMLNDLYCDNISDTYTNLTADLSMEEILKENPTHIFIVPMGDESKAFSLASGELSSDIWSGVKAVECGNIHYLSKDMFHYKPNQKWGEAYEILQGLIDR